MLANTSDIPKTRQWTTQERVWCVQKYLETKSFAKTQQNFLHVFGTELAPTKSAIFKMVKKFQYAGTVKNLNKKCEDRETHSGRKRLRTSHVIAMVRSQLNSHQNDKFWIELQRRFNSTLNRQWFQQDGATPYAANVSIEWLKQHFKKRIVSIRCQIEWPPYSPDLSPPDFYLWGYLEQSV